jgi:hypothetical protein
MEIADKNNNDHLYYYDRSRFRSSAVSTIITSALVGAMGIFVWPILRDMNGNWGEMFQTAALGLGVVLAVTILFWLYFFIRLLISFGSYIKARRERNESIIGSSFLLVIIVAIVIAMPLIVFFVPFV